MNLAATLLLDNPTASRNRQSDNLSGIWRVLPISGEERLEATIHDKVPITPNVMVRVAGDRPIPRLCFDQYRIFQKAKFSTGEKSATKEPTIIEITGQNPTSGGNAPILPPDLPPNPVFLRPWEEQNVDSEAQPADDLNLQSLPTVGSPAQVTLPVPVPSIIRQVSLDDLVEHLQNLYEQESDSKERAVAEEEKIYRSCLGIIELFW